MKFLLLAVVLLILVGLVLLIIAGARKLARSREADRLRRKFDRQALLYDRSVIEQRKAEYRLELERRAEQQNQWFLSGDPRGIYGDPVERQPAARPEKEEE